MKYEDEFNTKWGFGDGEQIPPDAEAYWVENMLLFNALLERHGSKVRVVCWFRCGMHNPYLHLNVSKEEYDALPERYRQGEACNDWEPFQDRNWGEPKPDDAYYEASGEADALQYGGASFVDVEVDFDKEGLLEYCEALRSGRDPEKAFHVMNCDPRELEESDA